MQIGPEMEDLAGIYSPGGDGGDYNTPSHSNNNNSNGSSNGNNSGNDNGTANGNGINNK